MSFFNFSCILAAPLRCVGGRIKASGQVPASLFYRERFRPVEIKKITGSYENHTWYPGIQTPGLHFFSLSSFLRGSTSKGHAFDLEWEGILRPWDGEQEI